MLPTQGDIFDEVAREAGIVPWMPRPLDHDSWPPNYSSIFAWRMQMLNRLRADPSMAASARAFYATRPVEFINCWCDTYDPRKETLKHVPFALFDKQAEFIRFLEDLRLTNENGLVEKCRDVGATWLACAYSVWALTFIPGDVTGWGSRKEDLVDKQGVMDSIFEKMRYTIQRLPDVFKPDVGKMPFMRIMNTGNGSSIIGESGDNIGRGGRTSRYMKDEAAFYERPEKIEAALGDNTKVQIDISSVNGLGNVFHRRRDAGELWRPGVTIQPGVTRVFVFSWSDHPDKTQEWYDQRKAKAEREGMQHIFAQEVDRNYSAAVDNTVIAYEWIEAAVDAHLTVPCLVHAPTSDEWMAGLDVADEGGDKNALALRNGVILRRVEEWGERDPGVTTRRMLGGLREAGRRGLAVQYDCIGIGAAVKTEYNSLVERGETSYSEFQLVPWHAGSAVVEPYGHVVPDDDDSTLNRDFFANMKAQAWWSIRSRFYKVWRARTQGEVYPADELISLDSSMPLLMQLQKELAQPTRGQSAGSLRMVIQKKPAGTRSPNCADAVVMAYFPAPESGGVEIGSYGG